MPKYDIPMSGAFGKIESGNLERSNVDITSEMITMLKAQQAFSGVSRLLQTEVDSQSHLAHQIQEEDAHPMLVVQLNE